MGVLDESGNGITRRPYQNGRAQENWLQYHEATGYDLEAWEFD